MQFCPLQDFFSALHRKAETDQSDGTPIASFKYVISTCTTAKPRREKKEKSSRRLVVATQISHRLEAARDLVSVLTVLRVSLVLLVLRVPTLPGVWTKTCQHM